MVHELEEKYIINLRLTNLYQSPNAVVEITIFSVENFRVLYYTIILSQYYEVAPLR